MGSGSSRAVLVFERARPVEGPVEQRFHGSGQSLDTRLWRLVYQASMDVLEPAHLTKHISLLSLSLHASSFHIAQRDDGSLNGTAVWLSGQALALVLPALLPARRHDRPRAIELGSGTGLTACVVCRV